jgi:hypothetical protein
MNPAEMSPFTAGCLLHSVQRAISNMFSVELVRSDMDGAMVDWLMGQPPSELERDHTLGGKAFISQCCPWVRIADLEGALFDM